MFSPVRKTHVVPTHLRTPETVLTFGGLSLSARQFLLLLVGAALSYDLWKHLDTLLIFPGGVILALLLAVLPILLACAFAFGRVAGQDVVAWTLALLRYARRPKRLVWHSVRFRLFL
jgi:hypothetical protein